MILLLLIKAQMELRLLKQDALSLKFILLDFLPWAIASGIWPNCIKVSIKSHEEGYNGKDLLECVEIDKKPGLIQKMDADGQPKRFQAHGKDCKIMKVITTDSKGQPTTMHRIDIPAEED